MSAPSEKRSDAMECFFQNKNNNHANTEQCCTIAEGEIKARKLCFNRDRSENLSIFICKPNPDEYCPISSELIGSTAYTPPYCKVKTTKTNEEEEDDDPCMQWENGCESDVSKKRMKKSSDASATSCEAKGKKDNSRNRKKRRNEEMFFSDFPSLSCAEMICGHRFDLRALLIHFMRNTMNCPMCRAGKSSITLLSCKTSFPNEKWMCEAEEKIQKEMQKEEDTQRHEDATLAAHLQSAYYYLPSLVLNSLQDHRVNASLFFYDTPIQSADDNSSVMFPIHGMQFEMELMPLQLHHRDLPRGISLYTSFSSNSITTPPSASAAIDTIRLNNLNPTVDANHTNDNINHNDINNINITASDGNTNDNENHHNEYLSTLLPQTVSSSLGGGGGGGPLALNDVTVQYTMSDSALRYLHHYQYF